MPTDQSLISGSLKISAGQKLTSVLFGLIIGAMNRVGSRFLTKNSI